ncbi:MAG: hypothetical protein IBX72_15850 [Nitrospirae bacterium]|nr:hypothetical protein [Nitrospirota bacterium]
MEDEVNFNNINHYFSIVTSHALTDSLLKAGFFVTLFLIIIRFGYGDTRNALFDLGAYFFIVMLLVAPVFGGKSLLVKLIDTSDYLTQRITQAMGGLEPKYAGGGAGALSAITFAKNEAYETHRGDLAKFKEYCYDPAANKYAEENDKERLKPSDGRLDYSDPLPLGTIQKAISTVQPEVILRETCAEYKEEIQQGLYKTYLNTLSAYKKELDNNGIDTSRANDIFDNASLVESSALFDDAVETARKKGAEGGSTIGKIINFFRGMDLRSLIMIVPRLVIGAMGITFLWIFDFYIYNVVVVLKTFAAMGIAFGVLYFIFLRKLDTVIAAAGFWMLGNAYYIVAAFALNNFYINISNTPLSSFLTNFVLGTKCELNDAFFMLALTGVVGPLLAGILTWKGIRFTLNFMGGIAGGGAIAKGIGGAFK